RRSLFDRLILVTNPHAKSRDCPAVCSPRVVSCEASPHDNVQRRTTMKRLLWLGLTAIALLELSQSSGAEEKGRSGAKPAVGAKEIVRINGGQGCRRTWQLLGEYTSVNEACWAARKFREEKKLDLEITMASKDGKFSGGKVVFDIYRN